MYQQFTLPKSTMFDQHQNSFQKLIILGNWTMLITLLITTICITITFGFEQYFTMPIQIAAHILTIIFAALFKVGYVIRCVGVHGLGFKVF